MSVRCSACRAVYSYGNIGRSKRTAFDFTDHAGVIHRYPADGTGSPCCHAAALPVHA
jgi:hypothetical protein